MSVLIRGMEMPEDCFSCPLKEEGFCNITNAYAGQIYERNSDCPLVEVSTPHGRLIDADGLIPDIGHDWNGYRVPKDDYSWECIDNAPTVIEAEGEE